jgi:hypothetical protein
VTRSVEEDWCWRAKAPGTEVLPPWGRRPQAGGGIFRQGGINSPSVGFADTSPTGGGADCYPPNRSRYPGTAAAGIGREKW